MPRSAPVPRLVALSACLTACAGTGSVPDAFTRAAAAAPPDAVCTLAVHGGEVLSLTVPLAWRQLPEPIARTVASIQPGGNSEAAREWSDAGDGYRIVTTYGDGDQRTLRLAIDGTVRERSHTLALDAVDEAARLAITKLRLGTITHVEATQGEANREWYRFWLRDDAGREHVVDCELDGGGARARRLLAAVLQVD